MSAKANIRVDETVLAALQETATRRHMTLDEVAAEAIMEGLKAERLNQVQRLLAKGHRRGAASGISESGVLDVIHADRKLRHGAR